MRINNISVGSFFLLVWCIELVYPPMNSIFPAATICFVCGIAWLAIAFLHTLRVNQKVPVNIVFLILYFFMTMLIPYLHGSSTVAHRYMSLMMIPIGPVIYSFYKTNNRTKELRNILILSGVLAFITFIRTFIALLSDAYIVRSIKSSGEYSVELARRGIGSYSFIYAVVCLSVLILYISMKEKTSKRYFLFVLYVAVMYFILKSNYMTAFLTSVIAAGVIILGNLLLRKNKTSEMLLGWVGVLLLLGLVLNIDTIVEKLLPFMPNRIASVFSNSGNGSIAQSIWLEFVGDRLPTLSRSINTFLKHPFIGALGDAGLTTSNDLFSGVGQHSYILDTFAIFGVFIGIATLFVIFIPFRNQRYTGDKNLRLAMIICVLGLYLFNNATEAIALVIGIVYPFIDDYIAQKERCTPVE